MVGGLGAGKGLVVGGLGYGERGGRDGEGVGEEDGVEWLGKGKGSGRGGKGKIGGRRLGAKGKTKWRGGMVRKGKGEEVAVRAGRVFGGGVGGGCGREGRSPLKSVS